MDRAEATGLGVALAGHGLLLAILSLGFATATTKKPILSEPVEVSFVEEAAPQSTAPSPPMPSRRALAEIEGPVEERPPPTAGGAAPVPAPPTPPPPKPVVQRPQHRARAHPAVAASAAGEAAPARPSLPPQSGACRPRRGRRSACGSSHRAASAAYSRHQRPETESRATTPPARAAGPAVQASLAAEIRRQLKPHWKAPRPGPTSSRCARR
jgi:hypothetical protein